MWSLRDWGARVEGGGLFFSLKEEREKQKRENKLEKERGRLRVKKGFFPPRKRSVTVPKCVGIRREGGGGMRTKY